LKKNLLISFQTTGITSLKDNDLKSKTNTSERVDRKKLLKNSKNRKKKLLH